MCLLDAQQCLNFIIWSETQQQIPLCWCCSRSVPHDVLSLLAPTEPLAPCPFQRGEALRAGVSINEPRCLCWWAVTCLRGKGQVSSQSATDRLDASHQDCSGKWACLFLHSLLSCLPFASGNGNMAWLMPPYETFTAFWMLSTCILNWMFANKSHGAAGWHDSPSASLGVILPCNTQGKQICIHSMTNLAVCFHWAGVHIVYFSPPFPLCSPFFLCSPLSLCVIMESFIYYCVQRSGGWDAVEIKCLSERRPTLRWPIFNGTIHDPTVKTDALNPA